MNASIVDMRYKTRDILAALENGESVTILYHGKPRGTIAPVAARKRLRVAEHEFFGMHAAGSEPVRNVMNRLRTGRHAV